MNIHDWGKTNINLMKQLLLLLLCYYLTYLCDADESYRALPMIIPRGVKIIVEQNVVGANRKRQHSKRCEKEPQVNWIAVPKKQFNGKIIFKKPSIFIHVPVYRRFQHETRRHYSESRVYGVECDFPRSEKHSDERRNANGGLDRGHDLGGRRGGLDAGAKGRRPIAGITHAGGGKGGIRLLTHIWKLSDITTWSAKVELHRCLHYRMHMHHHMT